VIVDDEPDFLRLLEGWLAPYYDVSLVSEPEGACERIAALAPDLVLLDVHMPELDGFSVCRRLRSEKGLAALPVAFLTGSRTDEDFLLHLDSGGSRYLTKPISRRELLDAVAEQLAGQKVGG
jgi:CheY-like chemotaxis protein